MIGLRKRYSAYKIGDRIMTFFLFLLVMAAICDITADTFETIHIYTANSAIKMHWLLYKMWMSQKCVKSVRCVRRNIAVLTKFTDRCITSKKKNSIPYFVATITFAQTNHYTLIAIFFFLPKICRRIRIGLNWGGEKSKK